MCAGREWAAHVDLLNHGTDILGNIANCKLPQVSCVIPDGAWSDHAGPATTALPYGLSWVAAVINAHRQQPIYWENTAVLVTWDDWGGWSDNQSADVPGHLPCVFMNPPTRCPSDYQYGFRVPLLVVSAYTPQGYISNTPFDFGGIPRTIEGINHLKEGMTFNTARSQRDLHAFFL